MIQGPLTPATIDTVLVPLPDAFERWRDLYLHSVVQKLALLVVVAVVLYLLARFARHHLGAQIEDLNRRHVLRKWIGYLYVLLVVAFGIALFADLVGGLGTMLAVLVAGIAVALQDILKSFVGWIYISSRSGIEIGSRVEVSGVRGDVIDIGVLKTTLVEVGNMVYGMQSSGRLITVPNYRMLSENVIVSGNDNPFVWHEVRITVTYESDWRRAETLLRGIGDELHAEIRPDIEAGIRGLERRYAFKYGTLTPIVYLTLGERGVELTLRYLVHPRRRRGSEDRVVRRILSAIGQEPAVHIAYPTHRIVRGGADAFPDEPPGHAGEGGLSSPAFPDE